MELYDYTKHAGRALVLMDGKKVFATAKFIKGSGWLCRANQSRPWVAGEDHIIKAIRGKPHHLKLVRTERKARRELENLKKQEEEKRK